MAATIIPTRFRLRRDTAANWAATNPIPLDGEPCLETDTGLRKLGDGVTQWNALLYQLSGAAYDFASLADGDTPIWDAAKRRWKHGPGGKIYQPGTGIKITAPDTSTPTISAAPVAFNYVVPSYADLPPQPIVEGKIAYVQDEQMAYPSEGATWPAQGAGIRVSGSSQLATFPAPKLTDFDAPIGAESTWEQRDNRISIYLPSPNKSNIWLTQDLPAAPFTIDAELGIINTAWPSSDAAVIGIGVSDGAKFRSIHTGYWASDGANAKIELGTWLDAQTFAGNTFHYGVYWNLAPQRTYLRITDDGTSRNYWSSCNGRDWVGWIGAVGESNTIGINGATKACLFARTAPGIGTAHGYIYGWRVTPYVRAMSE